ncbi:Hypothetical protein (plasmid) [Pseudomonas putida]|nr:Hypothetical protein [Pseudomonas putida]
MRYLFELTLIKPVARGWPAGQGNELWLYARWGNTFLDCHIPGLANPQYQVDALNG